MLTSPIRSSWVTDPDEHELSLFLELLEKPDKSSDVVLIQGCVHLVEHAERTRLYKIDTEEQ